ncbi:hypothetical protein, partial [Sphingopyxis sp.]|uniref:hypothetical protein n=1 Tax=Sphingopyxis sp. TaxID=1908224 RepID=UPI0025D7003E
KAIRRSVCRYAICGRSQRNGGPKPLESGISSSGNCRLIWRYPLTGMPQITAWTLYLQPMNRFAAPPLPGTWGAVHEGKHSQR